METSKGLTNEELPETTRALLVAYDLQLCENHAGKSFINCTRSERPDVGREVTTPEDVLREIKVTDRGLRFGLFLKDQEIMKLQAEVNKLQKLKKSKDCIANVSSGRELVSNLDESNAVISHLRSEMHALRLEISEVGS